MPSLIPPVLHPLVLLAGWYGGALVYEYGVNVPHALVNATG
ncbi:MAG: hypothetical protein WDA16_04265 [Candidatus Thermoplasmatota archaeon]